MIFVDTSALFALLDREDSNHTRAQKLWEALLDSGEPLFTTNYVVVETCALAQRRLGLKAARVLMDDLLGVIEIEWIGEALHQQATIAMLAAGRRQLSLVDCASFAALRARGLRRAFAFDRHFEEEGFKLPTVPSSI